MIITHRDIFEISKELVFENVNSYSEMNSSIKEYGNKFIEDYKNKVGMAFEIFTQFFAMKYGSTPLLNMLDILDTSDDPYNAGYDFTFTTIDNKPGHIQSKFKSDPTYQFKLTDLATNSAIASDNDIEKDNNILFTNIDDSENLFHYSYTTARNKRRIIGRNAQEEFILRDVNFWDEFRKCITESSKFKFEDAYKLRDIQEWIKYGHEVDGVKYLGTEKVLDGTLSKGRVCANTGAGKSLLLKIIIKVYQLKLFQIEV